MKKSILILGVIFLSLFFSQFSFVTAEQHTKKAINISINGKEIRGYDYFYTPNLIMGFNFLSKGNYYIGVNGTEYTLFVNNIAVKTVNSEIKTVGVSNDSRNYYFVYEKNGKDTLNINGHDMISVKGIIGIYSIYLSDDFKNYSFLIHGTDKRVVNGNVVDKEDIDADKFPFNYNNNLIEVPLQTSFLLHDYYGATEKNFKEHGYIEKNGDKLDIYVNGKKINTYDFNFNHSLKISKDFKNYAYYVGEIININGKIINTGFYDSRLHIWNKDFDTFSYNISEDDIVVYQKGKKYEKVYYHYDGCARIELLCFSHINNGDTYYNIHGKDIAVVKYEGGEQVLYFQGEKIENFYGGTFIPFYNNTKDTIIGLSFWDYDYDQDEGVKVSIIPLNIENKIDSQKKYNKAKELKKQLKELQKEEIVVNKKLEQLNLRDEMILITKTNSVLKNISKKQLEEIYNYIQKMNKLNLNAKQLYVIALIEKEYIGISTNQIKKLIEKILES